jgi:hypothetical protein
MHRALGGQGPTPSNEEAARGYDVSVRVIPEAKVGDQVSRWLLKALNTDWFRRALRQSERAAPIGYHPAVFFQAPGDQTGWLIVRLSGEQQFGSLPF